MTPRPTRTRACAPSDRDGRRAQAEGFWRDAEDLAALATGSPNTLVTLYVHAGIAAADAICCARLGEYSTSGNHSDAVALLTRADATLAPALQRLISVKSAAGYGAISMSSQRITDSRKAAERLIAALRRV
ncbi:MAG: hypothetical protein DI573_14190 [Microbacterium sp.]|uniref:hypothetical protein n=1 Tax=unclassified Microbacterium TaxID=2609290 RepID=UPI000DB4FAE5|nr:hypothetical protein [Microbacterium sp.]PZU36177.1 MAG: hypothetical protein DI573_14190 [Microbacterium sp.]